MSQKTDTSTKVDMLDVARQAVALAKKKGAADAAATSSRSREVEVVWRDGKLEKVSEATTRGLSIQLYVNDRYSAVSTSDLRPDALETFVADAIALTKALAADEHRKLPDPALYAGRSTADLDLLDGKQAELTADMRRTWAREAEEAARAADAKKAILSVTASFSDAAHEVHRVSSNGFEGSMRATNVSGYAEVSVNDPDGRRPQEYDYVAARHLADLGDAKTVGRLAAERTLARLGSKKGPSAVLPMVVDNRVAGRLPGMLGQAMNGGALQQKRSFLDGKLDKKLGSALFDVTDDPLIPRGLASRFFDGEGIAARPRQMVEKGVLRAFYIDTYYGRKLGVAPTSGNMSNTRWTLGAKGQADLIKSIKDGIFVTGFLGGNANAATGDYSLGIQGFRIHEGALAEAVGEMNIAGHQGELWTRLIAVGNDPFPYSASRTPTLVFDKVSFAGV